MQQQSVENNSQGDRLNRLRLHKQCNWADLALELGLSESYLYAIRAGKKALSAKALFKLSEVERETGLALPSTLEVAIGQHAQELHEAGLEVEFVPVKLLELEKELADWKRRANLAELENHYLRTQIRKLLEPFQPPPDIQQQSQA